MLASQTLQGLRLFLKSGSCGDRPQSSVPRHWQNPGQPQSAAQRLVPISRHLKAHATSAWSTQLFCVQSPSPMTILVALGVGIYIAQWYTAPDLWSQGCFSIPCRCGGKTFSFLQWLVWVFIPPLNDPDHPVKSAGGRLQCRLLVTTQVAYYSAGGWLHNS